LIEYWAFFDRIRWGSFDVFGMHSRMVRKTNVDFRGHKIVEAFLGLCSQLVRFCNKAGFSFVRNERANSVESSLQGISSNSFLWKQNKLSVVIQT